MDRRSGLGKTVILEFWLWQGWWSQLYVACIPQWSCLPMRDSDSFKSLTHARYIHESSVFFFPKASVLNFLPRLLKKEKVRKQVKKTLNVELIRAMWKLESSVWENLKFLEETGVFSSGQEGLFWKQMPPIT